MIAATAPVQQIVGRLFDIVEDLNWHVCLEMPPRRNPLDEHTLEEIKQLADELIIAAGEGS